MNKDYTGVKKKFKTQYLLKHVTKTPKMNTVFKMDFFLCVLTLTQ